MQAFSRWQKGAMAAILSVVMVFYCFTALAASSNQWALEAVNAGALRDSSNVSNVIVAIIDTGLDISHPAFAGIVVSPHNFTSEGGQSDVTDNIGHGTQVAGIIAAGGSVVGIASGAKIMPLKVVSSAGSSIANLAKAIRFAADNGASVINISLTMRNDATDELKSAISYARGRGCLLVAAAGNDGSGSSLSQPAALDGVIAVGAVGMGIKDGREVFYEATFSNYDASKNDRIVYAPGVDILTTYPKNLKSARSQVGANGDSLVVAEGTSMAAAHVSGVAALLKGAGSMDLYKDLLANTVKQDAYIKISGGIVAMSRPQMNILNCKAISVQKSPVAAPTAVPVIAALPTAVPISPSPKPTEAPYLMTSPDFYDVNGHWAAAAINSLASKKIVNGFDYGAFEPEFGVTRAEFVKMIYGLYNRNGSGAPTYSAALKFNDVTKAHWHHDYIAWGVTRGIVKGIYEDVFEPDTKITREQMAIIIYNFANMSGIKMTAGGGGFSDSDAVSPWAAGAVSSIKSLGVINGLPDGSFAPQLQATRAEAATIISNFLGKL